MWLKNLERRSGSPENPSTNLSTAADWLYDAFGARPSHAGPPVNEITALRQTTVLRCISLISGMVAQLPLPLYERTSKGKQRLPEHPGDMLLNFRANRNTPAIVYRETMAAHIVSYGNHFSFIEMDNAARIKALYPLPPSRTSVALVDGRKVFHTEINGQPIILGDGEVLHVPGFGFDGLIGYSPIQMARQSIGLALAMEEFGSRWFSNGSRLSGVLQHPNKMSEAAHKRLQASWGSIHTGLSNSHKAAILEEGMKWQQIGVPPEDAQFIESRTFQDSDIAKIFGVPPHLVGLTEKSTSWGTGIEQQNIAFLAYTLNPLLVRIEQVCNMSLLGAREAQRLFFEHRLEELLKADIKTRYEAYQIARQNGTMNANEWRALENQNEIPGPQGEAYWMPLNYAPADRVNEILDAKAKASATPAAPPAPPAKTANVEAFRGLLEGAALRCVRREAQAVGAKAQQLLGRGMQAEFREWTGSWYGEHAQYVQRQFDPILMAMQLEDEPAPVVAHVLAQLSDGKWIVSLDAGHVTGALVHLEEIMPSRVASELIETLSAQAGASTGETDANTPMLRAIAKSLGALSARENPAPVINVAAAPAPNVSVNMPGIVVEPAAVTVQPAATTVNVEVKAAETQKKSFKFARAADGSTIATEIDNPDKPKGR